MASIWYNPICCVMFQYNNTGHRTRHAATRCVFAFNLPSLAFHLYVRLMVCVSSSCKARHKVVDGLRSWDVEVGKDQNCVRGPERVFIESLAPEISYHLRIVGLCSNVISGLAESFNSSKISTPAKEMSAAIATYTSPVALKSYSRVVMPSSTWNKAYRDLQWMLR